MSLFSRLSTARQLVGNQPRFAGVQKGSSGQAIVAPAAPEPSPAPKATLELVNINSADKKALTALPSIGDATAQQLIKNRPYADFEELKSKSGISRLTDKEWAEIQLLVEF